jgi:hypothetical protein
VKARVTLGRVQLYTLALLARPNRTSPVLPDSVTRSLAKRGLVRDDWGCVYITEAGVRALADRERDA